MNADYIGAGIIFLFIIFLVITSIISYHKES